MYLGRFEGVVVDPDDARAGIEVLAALIDVCKDQGVESAALDAAEQYMKELPISRALAAVIADICADRLPGGSYAQTLAFARERASLESEKLLFETGVEYEGAMVELITRQHKERKPRK